MRFSESHAIIITMKHLLMLAKEAFCSHKRTQRTQKRAGVRTIPSFVIFCALLWQVILRSPRFLLFKTVFPVRHSFMRGRMPNEPILPRETKDHFPKRTHFGDPSINIHPLRLFIQNFRLDNPGSLIIRTV